MDGFSLFSVFTIFIISIPFFLDFFLNLILTVVDHYQHFFCFIAIANYIQNCSQAVNLVPKIKSMQKTFRSKNKKYVQNFLNIFLTSEHVKLTIFRNSHFGAKILMYQPECMGNYRQFSRRNFYNSICSTVKLKLKGL